MDAGSIKAYAFPLEIRVLLVRHDGEVILYHSP